MGRLIGIARRGASRAEMELQGTLKVTQADGLEGDYRGRLRKRQVTVLAREAWQTACQEVAQDLPWTTRRANLLVEGLELPRQEGRVLQIGALELEVTGETEPCSRMDEACDGLREALTPDWRGGVTCRVLNDAEINVGDEAQLGSRLLD